VTAVNPDPLAEALAGKPAPKRARKPRARKAAPPPARVSERVLRRLLALAKAEGIQVFNQDPGFGFRCAIVPDDEPPHEQAIELAQDLGFNLARGEWVGHTLNQEEIDAGDARSSTFACALLANLYAAEALALG